MKGPALPRPKKPPSHQRIKLLCSFGGSFAPRQPSGELRYSGGETRIISVDRRGINLSKLRSRLSDVGPNCTLPLCYQLPEPLSGRPDEAPPRLILIETDDDVRRMVEDHDRLFTMGRVSRLRLFICDARSSLSGYADATAFCSQLGHYDHLQNGILKKELALGDPNVRTYLSEVHNVSDLSGRRVSGAHIPALHRNGIPCNGYSGTCLASGNLGVRGESVMRVFRKDAALGVAGLSRNVSQEYNQRSSFRNMNRENTIPWNHRMMGTVIDPAFVSGVVNKRGLSSKFFGGHFRTPGNLQYKSKCHKFGGSSDIRYHRWGAYDARSYLSAMSDSGMQRSYDGSRLFVVKHYTGLRPRSNISKLGQGRSYQNQFSVFGHRVWQPSEERSLVSHTGMVCGDQWFNEKSASNCVCSCSLSEHSGKPVSGLGTPITVEDSMFFPSPEPHSIHSSVSATLELPTKGDESKHLAKKNGCISYDPSAKECALGESAPRGIMRTVFLTLDSSCDVPSDDVDKFDANSRNVNRFPESGLAAQLDHLCEAVGTLSSSSSGIDVQGSKSPLDVSIYKLSLSSTAEVCSTIAHSSLDTTRLPEPDPCGNTPLSRNNSGLHQSEGASMENIFLKSTLVISDSSGGIDRNISNAIRPFGDALELRLHKEVLQPPKISMEVSLGTEKELSSDGKNQEALPNTSNLQENASVVGKKSNDLKEAGENASSFPVIYSHLVSQELQTIKSSDLEEIRELGSGTYGTVFYGKWRGSDVAIKRLRPSCFSGGESGEDRLVTDFWKEACLLGQLHHPNVVALYGVVSDGPVTNLATVTEYMASGSLKQVLQRKDRTIDRRKRLIIAMDAAFGMEYLHEKNIVHFDLKSHNFLVNMKDPQRPICKIGDLGLSKVKRRTLVSGGVRGTIPWMAPELITSKSNMVSEKVDVYSFGIVMWELLTGEEPYENMRSEDIIAGIIKGDLRPEIPTWCDPVWRSLMERCWSSDPCSRPAFSEVAKELRSIAASLNIK